MSFFFQYRSALLPTIVRTEGEHTPILLRRWLAGRDQYTEGESRTLITQMQTLLL